MVTFVKGTMQRYTAQREFSLNFEDRKVKSVKVRVGEAVLYDGEVATYPAEGVSQTTARCPSLKAAINNWEWLVPASNGKPKAAKAPGAQVRGGSFDAMLDTKGLNNDGAKAPLAAPKAAAKAGAKRPGPEVLPEKKDDFDPKVGGSLDTMLAREKGTGRVVKAEDRVVKTLPGKAEPAKADRPLGAHPVSKDSSPVRELGTTVTNSTAKAADRAHSAKVLQSGDLGSERAIPIKGLAKKASAEAARKTFEVTGDAKALPEDFTADEVSRATGGQRAVTKAADNTQEARVVKKIGAKQTPADTPAETRVVKRLGSPKTKSEVSDAPDSNTRVVKTLSREPAEQTAEGITLRKTESRESDGEATVGRGEDLPASGGVEVAKTAAAKGDYLSMLPDNWAEMHWVKKEKFVKGIEDAGFVKFIMSIETVNIILRVCKERLSELGRKSAG